MGPFFGLVVLIGGAAFWWKKKRGLALPRRIQIKETASLGPKRSLVVAEVDGERLILASSEAGITLLRSDPLNDRADSVSQPVRVTREESVSSIAAHAPLVPTSSSALALFRTSSRGAAPVADSPGASVAVSEAASALFAGASESSDEPIELEGAASGLSRLRSLSGGLSQVFRSKEAKAEPPQERSLEDDWFVDVLEDSVEDQELRAKLAQGIGGRVT
jgi:flagellar biogenesis protein FliO